MKVIKTIQLNFNEMKYFKNRKGLVKGKAKHGENKRINYNK